MAQLAQALLCLSSLHYCNIRPALFYVVSDAQPQVWFQDLACHWHFLAASFADFFRSILPPAADFTFVAFFLPFCFRVALAANLSLSPSQNLRDASGASQLAVRSLLYLTPSRAKSRAPPLPTSQSDVTFLQVLLHTCWAGPHKRTVVQVSCSTRDGSAPCDVT